MRICTKCKIEKHNDEFYSNFRIKGGFEWRCISCRKIFEKERSIRNRDIIKIKSREYYVKNKDEIKVRKNCRERIKVANDPIYKLKKYIRRLIQHATKSNYTNKAKISKILGCSHEVFCTHLKNTAKKNYGVYCPVIKYDIDHIIPLSSAKTEEDVIRLNHYTNLQYLTPSDNYNKYLISIRKGE